MNRTIVSGPRILGALFLLGQMLLPVTGRPAAGATSPPAAAKEFYVATSGSDRNPGTKAAPFASLAGAQRAVRTWRAGNRGPAVIWVRQGTYYLDRPLVFTAEDSGSPASPDVYAACPGERVTISGGRLLECRWRPYKDGIWQCDLPAARQGGLRFTQLFVNGKRQALARFPDENSSKPGHSGYVHPAGRIPDGMRDPRPGPNDDMAFAGGAPRGVLFDPESFTSKRWSRPEEAVIHIFQDWEWGNMQWRLKAVDRDTRAIWFGEGGFQMGAKYDSDPARIGEDSRFYVEGVFEELDAPGEWYLDVREGTLFFMPEIGVDLPTARVEVAVLDEVVRFVGTQDAPVRGIVIDGFRIAHTASTFLRPYDVPSLGDWAVHRGGAVLFDGARDAAVRNCWFDAVGGNAVFVNNYNRNVTVTGCKFTGTGDSAVCLVGSLGTTNGTRRSFPYECAVSNNLIRDCGVFGKQIAGIYISRAKRITAAHNTIFNMPRAGICIGDGTWGGHVIEYNHIHDTVRETGDHGPFNAWGRDRYWSLTQSHSSYSRGRSLEAGDVKVDAMEPVVVRNNFFEETSGWGLDMDDGASNYEIYNNISKGVSVKLREGAWRTVRNNIWVDSTVAPCFHVGNEDNHDRYFHNITVMAADDVYSVIAPPARGPWLEEVDRNCFFSRSGKFTARVSQVRGEDGPERGAKRYDLEGWRKLGFDRNSVFADPLFVDPSKNDFRVRPDSPALRVGFENFEMGLWGVTEDFPAAWRDAETLQSVSPFPVGTAVGEDLLKRNGDYRAIVLDEYGSVTPENAAKIERLHPRDGAFDFSAFDEIVEFARENNKRVHGVALIWHDMSGLAWVRDFRGDRAAWERMFQTHIQTVVRHYRGKVGSWDVVNEAFNDDGTLRMDDRTATDNLGSIWARNLGNDYIARAFQYAHEADPEALLFYNDFELYDTKKPKKIEAVIAMVEDFKKRGIPIHGLGVQMHIGVSADNGGITSALRRLAGTGLRIHISELDILATDWKKDPGLVFSEELQRKQSDKYRFIAETYKESVPPRQRHGITVWGVSDAVTWINPNFGLHDWPLPFDEKYHKKKAYGGFLEGLRR
jgi:GH35 family endo-1,4-beta-xylanase